MNERKYLDELREKGNLGENVGYAVLLLARSYCAEGCSMDVVKNRLSYDLRRYEPLLNVNQRESYISNALKNADKSGLVKVDEILITKSEMDNVMGITSDNNAFRVKSLRRLAFALLCFAKFEMAKGGNDGWINCDLKCVYRAAKLTGRSQSQNNLYMHVLYEKGLVRFAPRKNRVGVRVNFVDNSENADIAVRVNDINYAGDYFLKYTGKKYIECAVCGRITPRKNNRSLYCPECAVIVNREKTRVRMSDPGKTSV
ncbi:MAG: hypothetical protein NC299_18255 [Lachnospiraceae bacterium]|nr:hypothetical protein [Lachnospiraceae bacterium]